MNDKFFSLSEQKRQTIINSALLVFSKYDYKRASTEEIAKHANVSKSLLFHYFGNKKTLYLFLCDYCIELITNKIEKEFNFNETDFFNYLISWQNLKSEMMKKNMFIFNFLMKAYYEQSPLVSHDINKKNQTKIEEKIKVMFSKIDNTKFKENVDINMLMKTITWLSDGYMKEKQLQGSIDIDKINKEFTDVLMMFKNNFYKGEYLK